MLAELKAAREDAARVTWITRQRDFDMHWTGHAWFDFREVIDRAMKIESARNRARTAANTEGGK